MLSLLCNFSESHRSIFLGPIVERIPSSLIVSLFGGDHNRDAKVNPKSLARGSEISQSSSRVPYMLRSQYKVIVGGL